MRLKQRGSLLEEKRDFLLSTLILGFFPLQRPILIRNPENIFFLRRSPVRETAAFVAEKKVLPRNRKPDKDQVKTKP